MAAGARKRKPAALGLEALLRHGNLQLAPEVFARQGSLACHDLLGRAGSENLAALLARTGPHVDEIVGRTHGVLVMLDDDDGVAEVPQVGEALQKPFVVTLMQADARLVQNVKHAREPRADLARKPDALHLAARQRVGAAVQGEIAQTHVLKEGEAARDGRRQTLGHRSPALRELKSRERRSKLREAHRVHLAVGVALVAVPHVDGQKLGAKSFALADGTGDVGAVRLETLPHVAEGPRIVPLPLQVVHHADEGHP